MTVGNSMVYLLNGGSGVRALCFGRRLRSHRLAELQAGHPVADLLAHFGKKNKKPTAGRQDPTQRKAKMPQTPTPS